MVIVPMRDDQDAELVCPLCAKNNKSRISMGAFYLHHDFVRVWDRDSEDGDGTMTTVSESKTTIERVEKDVIPGRRDAVDIGFHCENGHRLTMRIMQHKGCTYISWLK